MYHSSYFLSNYSLRNETITVIFPSSIVCLLVLLVFAWRQCKSSSTKISFFPLLGSILLSRSYRFMTLTCQKNTNHLPENLKNTMSFDFFDLSTETCIIGHNYVGFCFTFQMNHHFQFELSYFHCFLRNCFFSETA